MITCGYQRLLFVRSLSGAAPFVPPIDGSPVELNRKRRQIDLPQETAKMLSALEELWASGLSFLPIVGLSSALPVPLMTPLIALLVPMRSQPWLPMVPGPVGRLVPRPVPGPEPTMKSILQESNIFSVNAIIRFLTEVDLLDKI